MAELSTLARPYAKAAFSFAMANNRLDQWLEALNSLSYIVQSEKVSEALTGPSQTPAEQVKLIQSIDESLDNQVMNLVAQLAEHKRLLLLPEITEQFKAQKNQHDKMSDVEVTSAFETTVDQDKQLEDFLAKTLNSDVTVTSTVDKNLIGGVVIRAGDLVIDNSIRGRLAKLNEALGL
ncbi:MAG: F0F1 ATP synthase subunit delta [Cellvibrionales bacterium]|nr:F0F1 ATP synthase subunit delta [Cellvibrionales bacterium]